jgi:Mrp family chromosome partitioning ATPase
VEARNSVTQILIRDQLRRFASTLRRNKSRGARNVFSFSSVTVGGGTTSMVLELARTLVELGSRTLVVNADSLTENSVLASDGLGLTDVLIGKATADSVISQQQHFGLQINVVPYGTATESGIKRLDVLKVAIDAWAKEFDFVLIDIPALLPSADAELLVNEIGQVFLVVEAESVKKADVVRARHLLEKIDPDAVGLIVNRVPLENGGDSIKEQLVETVTGATSNRFMSTSQWSLRWNLFLLQVQKLGLRYKH